MTPESHSLARLRRASTGGKAPDMKQLSTEQRLARLIDLKAQRDEIDREIAALLGDAPPPRRTRPAARVMASDTSETMSHSKTVESADASLPIDPNGARP